MQRQIPRQVTNGNRLPKRRMRKQIASLIQKKQLRRLVGRVARAVRYFIA
jgi:hypothetical protein